MAQLVASISGVEVVGSNLARGKTFTASIGSFDSQYLYIFIYCVNLHHSLILCSAKAMMFVKLYVYIENRMPAHIRIQCNRLHVYEG